MCRDLARSCERGMDPGYELTGLHLHRLVRILLTDESLYLKERRAPARALPAGARAVYAAIRTHGRCSRAVRLALYSEKHHADGRLFVGLPPFPRVSLPPPRSQSTPLSHLEKLESQVSDLRRQEFSRLSTAHHFALPHHLSVAERLCVLDQPGIWCGFGTRGGLTTKNLKALSVG